MKHFPGYEIVAQIGETLHSVVYRARRNGESETVVLKALKAIYPSAAEIARFRHEYELIRNAGVEGIVKVLDIMEQDGGVALVLEDFHALSLKTLIRERLDLERFLDLSVRLAGILGNLHLKSITHKDIKPGNILYNPETDVIKLTDFGIASEITRATEEIYNPMIMEGTLAYMSPEQTGRMNCEVDYRTDLYSLGVTFYEMLTGGVPFMAGDPMEIIYSHIAKAPVPPHLLNPHVPEILSDIVLRLLAKAVEDRYQNCFGLQADLTKCLRQLQAGGRIVPFELGTRDVSLKFSIPQLLVGRDEALDSLKSAFERAAAGSVEVMLVAGEPGIGKSALVNEINKTIAGRRGYFISGKYELLRKHVPYSSIIQAFQDLARQLLSESEARLMMWRERLSEALGSNGKIITDAIPEIEWILGKQPPIPALGPEESQNRFNLVFRNFVRVLAGPAHPLVLFLDDLQWADAASLALMQAIVLDRSLAHFLLIGAYRDNETAAHHPLMGFRDQVRNRKVPVNTLKLDVLDTESINRLISNFLRSSPSATLPMAELIHAKTLGNPFFVRQFLKTLYEENHLSLDAAAGWQWQMENIRQLQVTENVVDLMTAKLSRLPAASLTLIQGCACIGNRFDLETVAAVMDLSLDEALAAMDELIRMGLIHYSHNSYRFHHDRIQEAAYALIPAAKRETLHYRIGQRLLERTPPSDLPARIFDITDQFNQAAGRITSPGEKRMLAELNLKAGVKAREATAYAAASGYLEHGMALLPENAWEREYELAYALHKERMVSEYLCRNFEASASLFAEINRHAKSRLDQANACHAMIVLYTTMGRLHEAIDLGLESIRRFGVRLNKTCGKGPILLEIIRFQRKMKQMGIEAVLDHPVSTDPERICLCELYGGVGLPAYYTNPNLFALAVLKGINGDLVHGLAHTSAFGFLAIATILGSAMGDFRAAYRIGEMALKLNERLEDKRHAAKVYFVFGFMIKHWSRPLSESLSDFRKAYRLGLDNGDLVYCGHSINEIGMCALMAGKNIDEVMTEHARFKDFQESVKDPFVANQSRLLTQCCLNLKGLTDSPLSLDTPDYSVDQRIASMRERGNPLNVFFLLLMKEKVSYLYGDYEEAYRIGFEIDPLLEFPKGSYYLPEHLFYRCLSLLAVYPDRSPAERRRIGKRLKGFQKQMKKWSASSPANYLHKRLLIEAEAAAVGGKRFKAAVLYRRAIQSARENGYVNNAALACERAARFYRSQDFQEIADLYLQKAHQAYERWGASGKVQEMEKDHPFLAAPEVKSGATHHPHTASSSSGGGINSSRLDLSTVMKVSQTISGEIVLDRLLGSIMKIAMMNAGARKGFFILNTDGRLTIEASRREGQDGDGRMSSATPLEECDELSAAIVHYVLRSGETVILGNAAAEGAYRNDPYVRRTRCRSILAMPIMHKGKISGILYLENNLTPHAFTPERLELLQIISTQAAISIENARLFDQATNDGLTRLHVHRYFHLLLDQEIARSHRYQRPFSLVMMDIDNFKHFNDTYGHQLGDEVLRQVARTVKKNSRQNDIAARYGGEEFVLILPETDIQGALTASEKIRQLVEAMEIPHGDELLRVTISLGAATFPLHATEKEALIRSADQALYTAKRSGKNRVSVGEKTC